MFQQRCADCGRTWNAAFGIVGTRRIAEAPVKCPHCGSGEIFKCADGWDDVVMSPLPLPKPEVFVQGESFCVDVKSPTVGHQGEGIA